jgi:hypothetical protein
LRSSRSLELLKTRAKEPTKVPARLVLIAALVASCGGDSDLSDAGVAADASVADAAPPDGGSCEGPASGGCEVVVGSAEQCPTLEEVCAGVCGASYDCCYCAPPDWQTISLECPPCNDAGADDQRLPAARSSDER